MLAYMVYMEWLGNVPSLAPFTAQTDLSLWPRSIGWLVEIMSFTMVGWLVGGIGLSTGSNPSTLLPRPTNHPPRPPSSSVRRCPSAPLADGEGENGTAAADPQELHRALQASRGASQRVPNTIVCGFGIFQKVVRPAQTHPNHLLRRWLEP